MKVTYNWLKEYTDFDLTPDQLVAALTGLGLEVDSVTGPNPVLSSIIVGYVKSKSRHDNADRLSVCEVDVGKETLSIVCGAPNVAEGQFVPVAPIGTTLPSGLEIKRAKIRGIESNGMICSEAELGLSNESRGIMVLKNGAAAGASLSEYIGDHDVLIDIDVTPNRPDCFGALGIAREIAAYEQTQLRLPSIDFEEKGSDIASQFEIIIRDVGKCPRFTARLIKDVKVGPSPDWLVKRLESIGQRPINNVVDITNYVMLETGHPMHAYDADLLAGQKIEVQTASRGDKFTTLDDQTHTLSEEVLMICDADKPVGIAGIMGGANTEVSEKTQNILLECAYFDPVNVRRSAKHLGISTEASKRFERGVDPNGLIPASARAMRLIKDLTGGEVASGVIDVYPREMEPVTIEFDRSHLTSLLGVEIAAAEVRGILNRLELQVDGEDESSVTVPTFRPDLTREADLIEEVARHYGYDKIPAVTQALTEQQRSGDKNRDLKRSLQSVLAGFGFHQVITYNMTSTRQAQDFVNAKDQAKLVNPLSEDMAVLRPSLAIGLLNVIRWNLNRKNNNIKVFEIGSAYRKAKDTIVEDEHITGALSGQGAPPHWNVEPVSVDFFHTKGFVEELLNRCSVADWRFTDSPSDSILGPERLAITIAGKQVGFVGKISKAIQENFDIEQPVYIFDLEYAALLSARELQSKFRPIPKFPPIKRDLAIVVDSNLSAADVAATIRESGGEYLRDLELFDLYTGSQVDAAHKSLAFSLTFYSMSKTLTEREVEAQVDQILATLKKRFSARLRT